MHNMRATFGFLQLLAATTDAPAVLV